MRALAQIVDIGGIVDERTIEDIRPDELRKYRQCHFFAGIGGWAFALELAGWPEDEPVWTGSCPCQPFSQAGKRAGTADRRDLWPVWRELIAECRPPTIFGEQVAGPLGREWLAGVRADLETLGYAVGAADLCAAGVGAPHIRQRLWWVADTEPVGCGKRSGESRDEESERFGRCEFGPGKQTGGMGDADTTRSQGWSEHIGEYANKWIIGSTGEPDFWSDYDLIPCLDGKARRIESGTFPLADGVPGRVAKLRGLGNAIVPQVAAVFIRAFIEEKGWARR